MGQKTFKHLYRRRYEQGMIEPNSWDKTFRQPFRSNKNEHETVDEIGRKRWVLSPIFPFKSYGGSVPAPAVGLCSGQEGSVYIFYE